MQSGGGGTLFIQKTQKAENVRSPGSLETKRGIKRKGTREAKRKHYSDRPTLLEKEKDRRKIRISKKFKGSKESLPSQRDNFTGTLELAELTKKTVVGHRRKPRGAMKKEGPKERLETGGPQGGS